MTGEGEKKMRGTVVCVTGGAGYIGSWLVRKLLGRGCVVHATLRSLEDEKKAGLLRSLPGAAERLRLFQADMYDADTFEPAIAGCEFVFLVATPLAHDPTSTKAGGTGALLMGNGAHARVLGVGTVTLKFTSRKTVQLKNV